MPSFPIHQKRDDLLKLDYDYSILEVTRATRMYKLIQAASLCSCAIARHLKQRECSNGNVVTRLKEELSKLREAHSGEICLLKEKLKKAEDKCSAREKEWKVKENPSKTRSPRWRAW